MNHTPDDLDHVFNHLNEGMGFSPSYDNDEHGDLPRSLEDRLDIGGRPQGEREQPEILARDNYQGKGGKNGTGKTR